MQQYDAVIIGAGLMGSFAARHLARRGLRVAVLERENDVSMGISRANTAIVYAGYDMKPGTLKARLVVQGNAALDALCAELGVLFNRTGSLMVASGPRAQATLEDKLMQGQQNGVPDLRLLDKDTLQSLEPGVSKEAVSALYAPTTGTVNPWELCLAAAQDANRHGASFFFEHEVIAIERSGSFTGNTQAREFTIRCSNGACFSAPVVLNCAGISADEVSELVAPVHFRLELSSGSYLLLDTYAQGSITHVVFSEPERKGKGATFVPTTEDNLLLGPSEEWLDMLDNEPGYATTLQGLEFVRTASAEVFPGLPLEQVIRSFGTLRPNIRRAEQLSDGSVVVSDTSIHDLHIAWAAGCPGLLNIAGVKTPGLTCADGIGRYAADMVEEYLDERGGSLQVMRQGCGRLSAESSSVTPSLNPAPPSTSSADLSDNTTDSTPSTSPAGSMLSYHTPHSSIPSLQAHTTTFADDEIICRCRQVSAREVRATIRSEVGARTVDGIKRRVGCGLGRCQGGFCMERVMLMLAEEWGLNPSQVIKDRSGSWIVSEACVEREAISTPSSDPDQLTATQSASLPSSGHHAVQYVSSIASTPSAPRAHAAQHTSSLGSIPSDPELLIIGGGAAGLAAACSAVQAGLAPEQLLLVERLDALGGILPQCTHRGFGEREHGGTLTGAEFLAPLLEGFTVLKVPTLLRTTVTALQHDRTVTLAGPEGRTTRKPKAIVFATGCREQALGALPVAGARPSGVFTAGAAQRMVNLQNWSVGERIVILGGGDVGMIMAGTLTQHGKQILAIVEQAADVNGLKANKKRYVEDLGIPLLTNSTITQVHGHRRIEAVTIKSRDSSESQLLACDTLLVSTGLIPETDLIKELNAAQDNPSSHDARTSSNAFSPHDTRSSHYAPPAQGIRSALDHPSSLPPWLFLAGNARRVHSFIEGVVHDGQTAGARAAEYRWHQNLQGHQ